MTHFLPEGKLLHEPENDLSAAGLARAMADGRTLEAVPTLCDEYGLHFSLSGLPARMPREEAVYAPSPSPVREAAVRSRVGRPTCFCVTQLGENGALLSRRRAQQPVWEALSAHARPGDILPATVTHTAHFGAFCDIGRGLSALLPVSRLSISRVEHSAERLHAGQDIFALIAAIDRDAGRVTLSTRELLGTWEENAARFAAGQTVTAIVRGVQPYGVFLELTPNLCGLAEPDDRLEPGDVCAVYIKSIQPEKQKIKLAVLHTLRQLALPPQPLRFSKTAGRVDAWCYHPGDPLTVF